MAVDRPADFARLNQFQVLAGKPHRVGGPKHFFGSMGQKIGSGLLQGIEGRRRRRGDRRFRGWNRRF
jgi:hypothetical protein